MLNGIGFVTIARLDLARRPATPTALARIQSVWVAIGIAVFVVTLLVVRDVRVFERYRYTSRSSASASCCSPARSRHRATINGGRLWVAIGPLTFEPSEIAKVLARRVLRGVPRRQTRAAHAGPHRSIGRGSSRRRATSARCSPGASRSSCSCTRRTSARRCCSSGCSRRCSTWRPNAARTSSARSSCSRRRRVRRRTTCSVTCATASRTGPTRGRPRTARASRSSSRGTRSRSGGVDGTGLGLGSPDRIPQRVDRLRVRRDR